MRSMDEETGTQQGLMDRALSRRRFTALAAASAVAALSVACGGSTSAPTATTAAGTTAPGGAATRPGDVRRRSTRPTTGAAPPGGVRSGEAAARRQRCGGRGNGTGQGRDARLRAQHRREDARPALLRAVLRAVHALSHLQHARRYDKDFNIVPDLATSWDVGGDGKTITFHLRPNVKFHDGTDCDAAAVKWNFDRILDDKVNAPVRSSAPTAAHVRGCRGQDHGAIQSRSAMATAYRRARRSPGLHRLTGGGAEVWAGLRAQSRWAPGHSSSSSG